MARSREQSQEYLLPRKNREQSQDFRQLPTIHSPEPRCQLKVRNPWRQRVCPPREKRYEHLACCSWARSFPN